MKLVILSKAKYTKRTKGKDGKWVYEYGKPKGSRKGKPFELKDLTRDRGAKIPLAEYAGKVDMHGVPVPVKINGSIRQSLNKAVNKAVSKNYYDEIPLTDIDNALRSEGYLLLQEDNTAWSGFLTGDDSGSTFTIGKLANKVKLHGKDTYSEVENSGLRMTWYKMSSGKYEIVKYVT